MTFGDGLSGRAEFLKNTKPQLIADLRLFPTEQGGRKSPAPPGWGCPCSVDRKLTEVWDGWPVLGDREMRPGESRRVGFFFLSGETAAAILRKAGKFYLWEIRFVGEAIVIEPEALT